MNKEELKRLAETLRAEDWPAALEAHLAEQRGKPMQQRIEELEAAQLLLSVGFLRLERTLERLVGMLEGERR